MDEKIAAEEATPITSEERSWFDLALQAVPEDQRTAFGSVPLDVLCVSSTSPLAPGN